MYYRTTVGELERRRFLVLPTFAAPHCTVIFDELSDVIELAAAFGDPLRNPYADLRRRSDETR
jgi:hypothetical protein